MPANPFSAAQPNPFSSGDGTTGAGAWNSSSAAGAWSGGAAGYEDPEAGGYTPPAPQPPSAYPAAGGSAAYPATGSSLQAKELELQAKERELAAREAQLKKAEADLLKSGGVLERSNWPRCYPVCHFDISDCKPENRLMVWIIYFTWIGLAWCLMYNFFAATVMLGYSADNAISSWFLAVIYMLIGIPMGFWLWCLRFYRGVRDESSVGQLFFFLYYVVNCGFCTWAAIGYPFSHERWSFAGFIVMTDAWDYGSFPGVVYIIGASFWAAEAGACWLMLIRAWAFFRGIQPAPQKSNPFTEAAIKTASRI